MLSFSILSIMLVSIAILAASALFLSGFIVPSQSSHCIPNAYQVALFVHADYQGQCIVKGLGQHRTSDRIGLPNDSISSIRVGSKVWAALFADNNYKCNIQGLFSPRPICETFFQDDANLSDNIIRGDTVSSVIVATYPEVRLYQTIYVERSNYGQLIQADKDRDGLKDNLEARLANQFKPYLQFDKDENARRIHEPYVLFQVTPEGCAGEGCPGHVYITIRWVFLFIKDGGYGPGTGFCKGTDSHPGDNDIATFLLKSVDRGRTWTLMKVELGRSTIVWPQYSGQVTEGAAAWIEQLLANHPVIYMSTGKHHMFLHRGDWGDSPYSDVPVLDNCADDNDGDGVLVIPDLRSVGLPNNQYNNVGEHNILWYYGELLPRHPTSFFVNDLRHLFPSEDCPYGRHAWSNYGFCGGTPANQEKWLSLPIEFRPRP